MTWQLRVLSIFIATVATVGAQETSAPTHTTRLQQMEAIYQKELSARHIPLLGKYLTELQRHRAAATADELPAYDAEIARIQEVISSGGVLDLIATQQSPTGQLPMPTPMPAPTASERKDALIVLTPALATRIAPALPDGATTATASAAEWRIDNTEAGTYDVLIHYSAPELSAPLIIRVEYAGQTIEKEMETSRVTKDAESFRIFRLGTLALTADQRGETLRLTVGDAKQSALILKSVLITKPRPSTN
ncbi:MAG: hypothetical protein R3F13_21120 [Prosthecobacter sp.]